jgi:hypothetical protein
MLQAAPCGGGLLLERMGDGSGSMARLADRCAIGSAAHDTDRVESDWDVRLARVLSCVLSSSFGGSCW